MTMIYKMPMKRLLIISLIMTLAAPAYADYHYASHEGSNEYPYTSWETAAELIQDAVDAVSPHDTVYIGNGEYYESIVADCDSIAIIGMGWDSTMLWYDVDDTTIIRMEHNRYNTWYVEGIRFELYGDYVSINGGTRNNLHVNQCWFTGDRLQGAGGVGAAAAPNFTLIENCVFDSLQYGMWDILGTPITEVRNCIFTYCEHAITYDNHYGIIRNNIIANGHPYRDPVFGETDSLLAINNLIYGHSESFNCAAIDTSTYINNTLDHLNNNPQANAISAGNHRAIINNSISNIARGTWVGNGARAWIKYNNFWNVDIMALNEGMGQIDTSEGNIRVDPMYIGNEDYHLQAYSPLIDAGHPDIFDVDGTRSDIGCYGGPGGCSYTYLDLAPRIPDSIEVDLDSLVVTLIWPYNTEADFNRYQIFRDTIPGFEPSIFDMIAEPESSYYADNDIEPGVSYYYRLTSVDNQGNVSDYSDEVAVIPTFAPGFLDDGLPKYTVIKCAYPNPANSKVTIVYSASNLGPQPPEIRLAIYDIQGRIVRTLVDQRKPAGTYRAIWDGTNDSGESVASSTYIAKVFQWGMDAGDYPVKITLIK
ncbi:MAG: hypothetical protein GY839_13040 [candidate division Zixibacteria bacterium]|nr:hypothetical protein [candidate division Zixibacteria bacterium]